MLKEEQDSHIDSCFSQGYSAYAGNFFVIFSRKEDEQLHMPFMGCKAVLLLRIIGYFNTIPKGGACLNKKLNPLTENHLFTKAFTRGSTESSKLCAVYILKNIKRNLDGSLPKTKIGIAVNAKLGGAVARNRVKRIIREGVRPLYEKLSDGLIVVISARGAAFSKSAKSTAMNINIDSCFTRLGAYRGMTLKARESSIHKTYLKNNQNKGKMPQNKIK